VVLELDRKLHNTYSSARAFLAYSYAVNYSARAHIVMYHIKGSLVQNLLCLKKNNPPARTH
jgi:hypothetical protein